MHLGVIVEERVLFILVICSTFGVLVFIQYTVRDVTGALCGVGVTRLVNDWGKVTES